MGLKGPRGKNSKNRDQRVEIIGDNTKDRDIKRKRSYSIVTLGSLRLKTQTEESEYYVDSR